MTTPEQKRNAERLRAAELKHDFRDSIILSGAAVYLANQSRRTGSWISDFDRAELQRKADAYPKLVEHLKIYASRTGEYQNAATRLLKELREL